METRKIWEMVRQRRGLSTVIGTVLFMVLIFTVASVLFVGLYRYNDSVIQSIAIQQDRYQEGIKIVALSNTSTYITGIQINNTGSITSRISAIYIDNSLWCNPSENKTLNPEDTYISAKDSLLINIPQTHYNPTSTITAVTERGCVTVALESDFMPKPADPPPRSKRPVYGPLELDFDKFYYANCTSAGIFNSSSWKPGWTINQTKNGETFVWNITVTNVDPECRNVVLSQYSALTLMPTDVSQQSQWYIEPSGQPTGIQNSTKTLLIEYNRTINIIYIYKQPLGSSGNMNAQTPPNVPQGGQKLCKVFLAFFGRFEKDGIVSSYGQTIPFEAVLVLRS